MVVELCAAPGEAELELLQGATLGDLTGCAGQDRAVVGECVVRCLLAARWAGASRFDGVPATVKPMAGLTVRDDWGSELVG